MLLIQMITVIVTLQMYEYIHSHLVSIFIYFTILQNILQYLLSILLFSVDSIASTSTSADIREAISHLDFANVSVPPPRKKRALSRLPTKTLSRRPTLDVDCEISSGKAKKNDDSLSDDDDDYRELFMENLLEQRQNHQLQSDVLKLQKAKMEAKMDIEIETSKVELEKKKLDLETSRALAEIEIQKKKKLAELEIEKMKKDLDK